MEQLQDRSIALLHFNHIVHFFLKTIHWGGILIEIAGKNYEISFPIIISIIGCFLLDKSLHFFYLLVASHKCLNVKRHAFSIVTCLEMRMEEVKFVATNFTKVDFCVKYTFHRNSVITDRRKLIICKVRICDGGL